MRKDLYRRRRRWNATGHTHVEAQPVMPIAVVDVRNPWTTTPETRIYELREVRGVWERVRDISRYIPAWAVLPGELGVAFSMPMFLQPRGGEILTGKTPSTAALRLLMARRKVRTKIVAATGAMGNSWLAELHNFIAYGGGGDHCSKCARPARYWAHGA
jgi:hypothetical protein